MEECMRGMWEDPDKALERWIARKTRSYKKNLAHNIDLSDEVFHERVQKAMTQTEISIENCEMWMRFN